MCGNNHTYVEIAHRQVLGFYHTCVVKHTHRLISPWANGGEEEVEEVESQVVEMEPAEEGLEVEATPSVPTTNFRVMDMYLHKVLGYPPWPVQVSRVEGDKISVVYYGTGEVATLRKAAHSRLLPFTEEII